ncbi:MAG: hypothetical protein MUF13_06385 [Akkermansiaceae bacterium]|nr:hypothetical protein [Akkermansiaceae bacterium]
MSSYSNNRNLYAAALLGFLAMGTIGWNITADPKTMPAAPQEQASIESKSPKRLDRPSRRFGAPEAVRKRMAGIRAISSPGDRMRATIELANSLPVSEIAAWLDGRWFDTGQGFDVTLFNKILNERWAKEDPEGLVLWGMKNNSGNATGILADWAKTEPQRVLDFFKAHPNREMELASLTVMAEKHPAIALQALRDMNPAFRASNGMNDYYTRQLMKQLAISAPAALESAIDSMTASMQVTAEAALSGERLKSGFETEINRLFARADGWKIFQLAINHSEDLGDSIFNHLANLPPRWRDAMVSNSYSIISDTDSEKWCSVDLQSMGFSESQASSIQSMAFTKYGYRDPEAAIRLMVQSNLSDGVRNSMIGNVFRNYRGDPEKTDSLIALLGSEKDQQMARAALAANSRNQHQQTVSPAEWLNQIASNSNGSYQYLSNLDEWDKDKLGQLQSEFKSLPAEKKQSTARIMVQHIGNTENARSIQGEALHYLVANPEEPKPGESRSDIISEASEYAVRLAKEDPSAATDWVNRLPAGEAREWAQKNLAANWAQYDPDATHQWIGSLPAGERDAVKEYVEKKTGKRP